MFQNRFVRRAFLILAGIVVALAALELILQIAAWYNLRSTRGRQVLESANGRPIIAFVGDSNVYGLYVGPNETVAKCLERLSLAADGRGCATVNLAVAGAPTWNVLEQAKKAAEYAPAAIVVRAGINNFTLVPPGEGAGFLEKLRIVKLARIVREHWTARDDDPPPAPEAEPSPAGARTRDGRLVISPANRNGGVEKMEIEALRGQVEYSQIEERYKSDLIAIGEVARGVGAKVVIATYLSGMKPRFSDLRKSALEVAAARGYEIADCARIPRMLTELIQKTPVAERPRLAEIATATANGILSTKDDHPTAFAYGAESYIILEALVKAGVLTDKQEKEKQPFAGLPGFARLVPRLSQDPADRGTFLYEGLPKDRVQVLFGVAGATVHEHIPIPLDMHSWRRADGGVVMEQNIINNADGRGRTRIVIPADMMKKLAAATRVIAFVRRGGNGGDARTFVSEPVELAREGK